MPEYVAVPATMLHRITRELGFAGAAVAEPLANSMYAVLDRSRVRPGDSVVVSGPGIIGLFAAQIARLAGAHQVVVVGAEADEPLRLTSCQTSGLRDRGCPEADVSLEARAIPAPSPGDHPKRGTVTLVGLSSHPSEVSLTPAVRKELTLLASYAATWENYEQSLSQLQRGSVEFESLVSSCPASRRLAGKVVLITGADSGPGTGPARDQRQLHCSGYVETKRLAANWYDRPGERERIHANIPVGRIATPLDVAKVLEFLVTANPCP